MKQLVISGVVLMVGAELIALLLGQRPLALWAAGAAVALLLFGIRRLLGRLNADAAPDQLSSDDAADLLQRWMSGTEIRIRRAETTRAVWDRHWRPILAQRFEVTTGQRRSKGPAAFDATGRMLFGERLWEWVDPGNVIRSGADEPGPGRTALEEILKRMEQQ